MKLFKLISFLQFINMSYERNVNTVEKKHVEQEHTFKVMCEVKVI